MAQESRINAVLTPQPSAFFTLVNRALMIDLETMATNKDAAILSIGAVVFDIFYTQSEETLRQYSFYTTVSLEDNMRLGRKVSASTIIWWLRQSSEARMALFENNVNLLKALDDLRQFIELHKPTHVWAKGPTFDIDIMKDAFEAQRMRWPFEFWMERCVRTIEDAAYPNGDDKPNLTVGEKHNALDDAITQSMMMQHCYRRLGLAHDYPANATTPKIFS